MIKAKFYHLLPLLLPVLHAQNVVWRNPPRLHRSEIKSAEGMRAIQVGDGIVRIDGARGSELIRLHLMHEPSSGLSWWRMWSFVAEDSKRAPEPLDSSFDAVLTSQNITAAWANGAGLIVVKQMARKDASLETLMDAIIAEIRGRTDGSFHSRDWYWPPKRDSCQLAGGTVFCFVSISESASGW